VILSAIAVRLATAETLDSEVVSLFQRTMQREVASHVHTSLVELAASQGRRLTRRQMARLKSGVAEQLEWYRPEPLAYESRISDADQSKIVLSITPEAYGKELKSFVENQKSRYIKNEGNKQSGEYLRKQFSDLGYEVHLQENSFAMDAFNVVAFKKGSREPNKFVLVGAHFDSVNWENTDKQAPGAEDNGSGVAALLQVAKALKDIPTDRSVAFVGFNGEEEGTLGSQTFVDELMRDGGAFSNFGALQAALIMDEIAYPSKEKKHDNQVILETSGKDKVENRALVNTVARGLKAETSIKTPWINYHGFGSDHMSFLEAGFPALLLIERDNMFYSEAYGHSSRDTLDHTDSNFGSAMTRLATRGILSLANPTGKQIDVGFKPESPKHY